MSTATGTPDDVAEIERLRARLLDADNTGHADLFGSGLAADVVIVPPGLPVMAGRDACVAFVRSVFSEFPRRRLQETIDELRVSGDLAFERGTFAQTVFERGEPLTECGRYFRLYARTAEGWKLSRITWTLDPEEEHIGDHAAQDGHEVHDVLPARAGHFRLESGYHTDAWLDLDALFIRPARLQPLIGELADRIREHGVSAVAGPLTGGAFLAQALARELDVEFYCAVPAGRDATALFGARYQLPPAIQRAAAGKRVAVADDAISAGSSVRATIAALQSAGAQPIVAGALLVLGTVGRSYLESIGMRIEALHEQPLSMWPPADCPLCKAGMTLEEPRGGGL